MGNNFDLLERAWPERKIFQGAASAYIRYTSRPQLAWTYLEQPLWKHVLSFFNSRTRMLDFGAGTGRITWEALRAGLRHYHIVAYEPNELLAREFGRGVGMRCYRSRASTLSKSRWAKDGFTLITANMVFNHLDDAAYEDMVKESRAMLGPTGTLVYTIPHPIYKSMKYGFYHT